MYTFIHMNSFGIYYNVYLVKFLKNILQDNMQLLYKKSRALFSRNPKKKVKLWLTSFVCLFIFRQLLEVCQKGREYVTPGLFFNFFMKGGDSDGLCNS